MTDGQTADGQTDRIDCCSVTAFCQVQNSLRPPSLALSYWQRYCTAVEQWARAKLCGVEHKAPPIFGKATITLDTGILVCYILKCEYHFLFIELPLHGIVCPVTNNMSVFMKV